MSSVLNNNIYFKKHFQDILIVSFGYMFVIFGFGLGIYYIMKHIPSGEGDCEHEVFYFISFSSFTKLNAFLCSWIV